jgi:hypothetical protein
MRFRNTQSMVVLAGLIISAAFVSCSPLQRVRVGLDAVMSDPAAYEGYELIITTTIADVLDRYDLYRGRRIEITAPFAYYGHRAYWTWYLLLEENGQQVRCYTHHYRLAVGRDAESLLLRARDGKHPVTVNGILRKDGIDIREIWYDNQLVRPDVKPPRMLLRYPWYF